MMMLILLELSSLGIFPQFNKHAFIRDVVDIINKDLHMVNIPISFLL
jgi:hypothetical protein